MKTRIEIRSIGGGVMFSHEEENNSVKRTLEAAVKSGADLRFANLSGADLSDADLRCANLSGANLSDANLSDADLRFANLSGVNLSDAYLSGVNLRDANLRCANLSDADLSGADLRFADLRAANLYGANLSGADLYGANLSDADLRGANLSDADLRGANLSDADLRGATYDKTSLWYSRSRILPDDGDITGYKKCRNGVIVKLLIKDGTPRGHAFGRKCRAQGAEVLEVIGAETGLSQHDPNFKYEAGKTVSVGNFDPDFDNECAPGIHFFITKAEAENY